MNMTNEAKTVVEHAVVLIRDDGTTTTTAYKNADDAFKHYMALITDGKKVVMEARRKGELGMDFAS